MSAQHPLSEEWDRLLHSVFARVDEALEKRFGSLYPQRSNRPKPGETVNPQWSGLFNVGTSFTAGFGSEQGRGYVIDIDFCTYQAVDPGVREEVTDAALELIREGLALVFPERKLDIIRDGPVFKIVGDLNLGDCRT